MGSGRKFKCSRLKFYTYSIEYCRICQNTVNTDKLNLHFMRAHPNLYYSIYPGRKKVKEADEN
jgi:hypothetical protein